MHFRETLHLQLLCIIPPFLRPGGSAAGPDRIGPTIRWVPMYAAPCIIRFIFFFAALQRLVQLRLRRLAMMIASYFNPH